MALIIGPDLIRTILSGDSLSRSEVLAIARIAYLATELDFREERAEREALEDIGAALWSAAGIPPEPIAPVSPLPLDDEERRARIAELVPQLGSRGARELAYVIGYLGVASDLELAPVQGRFLDELQHALRIGDERAADLVASGAEAATPGIEEVAPGAHATP